MRVSPDTIERAYSLLTVKAVNAAQRTFSGIATTPSIDRGGDIIEPLGVTFANPLPLLLHHDARLPVGTVTLHPPTADGIAFTAHIPAIDEAGTLKDRVDEAWQSVKAGIIRGVSVKVLAMREGVERIKHTGGLRWLKSQIVELSLVSIPMNQDATIQTVKHFDHGQPAASGTSPVRVVALNPSGVTDHTKAPTMKTITEQISAFEATRQAKSASMTALMNTAAEKGETLDAAQTEEYDTLASEVKSIDAHLARLSTLEQTTKATAVAVNGDNPQHAAASRGGAVISVKGADLPKGTAFARYAMALAATKGDIGRAIQIVERNKHWMSTTPQVLSVLKTGVDVGDTLSTGWAEELTPYREMASEFVEFLRPMTLLGKIQGFHRVPFNVKFPVQTDGTVGSWVGEGLVKPVGKLTFDTATLRFTKVAKIVLITEELARFSNPSAEGLVRTDLANGIVQAIDETFIDPDINEITDVRPAAITYQAEGDTASGVDADDLRTDVKLAFGSFIGANIPTTGLAWVMQPNQALALGLMLNQLGQPEFPGLGADGGSLFGYPVYTSQSVPTGIVALIKPSEIMLADDGGANVDISREATVLMDDGASPAGTTSVSLWQQNAVGIRAERTINWKKRRPKAVYVIDTADYGGSAG